MAKVEQVGMFFADLDHEKESGIFGKPLDLLEKEFSLL